MKGDGWVDMGWLHQHTIANIWQGLRIFHGERDVFVAAKPHTRASNGRIAMIHPQRLQANIDHGPTVTH